MVEKKPLSPEAEKLLQEAFHKNLPEQHKLQPNMRRSCSCSGCSCPPGHGDICDGGTYAGHAGGYFGANLG